MASTFAAISRLVGMHDRGPVVDSRPQPAHAPWELVRDRSHAYLRRRRAKELLVIHGFVASAMAVLTAWWVVPRHTFTGRTLYIFAPGRGVHVGDLPALGFVLIGLASIWQAARAAARLTA